MTHTPGELAVPDGIDPVFLQVLRARLSGIVREMQLSLFRTGYSTIIRESQDASCALLTAGGDVIAQHVVLPLHMGAFPACCAAVLDTFGEDIADGDAFLLNHTYEGGSPHAPDFAVLVPIFADGTLFGFAASMAHKGDIGGAVPGSSYGQAREVFNEGLLIPAVRYQAGGRTNTDVERIVGANSRTPELVLGDLRGQLGASRLGERRLRELTAAQGADVLRRYFDRILDVAEARLRRGVAAWPDGRVEAVRLIDDDGITRDRHIRVHVAVDKRGDRIRFDFSGTDGQTEGPANVRPPIVRAACAYALICLLDAADHINSGLLRVVELTAPEGSVVNPRFPAPVNTYNPTVHAVVDAVFDALSGLAPGEGRADGCASRSFVLSAPERGGVQYEIFGGGTGAHARGDGASGSSVNHTNGRIAPIEIVESEFPVRVLESALIADSGGAGEFRGGLGIRRAYQVLEPTRLSLRSTRHSVLPLGVRGGGPGRPGRLVVDAAGRVEELPARCAGVELRPGDVFRLDTPGGGGFGDPRRRDPALVLADVADGYCGIDHARDVYGVQLVRSPDGQLRVDEDATRALRVSSIMAADPGT